MVKLWVFIRGLLISSIGNGCFFSYALYGRWAFSF